MPLRIALRQRLRDWPTSLTFALIIVTATALAGAWLAIAVPLLLSPLPYHQADRLVAIESLKKGVTGGMSWLTLEDLRSPSTEVLAAWLPRTWGFQTDPKGHVEVVLSQQVTGEFFDALGVRPALGVPLTKAHEQAGNQAHVWLTDAAFKRLLGGDPQTITRTVWINAVPYRVAGVLPADFQFPYEGQAADIYLPLNRADFYTRGSGWLGAVVRLKSGVTAEQFSSELNARAQALETAFPASNRDLRFTAKPLARYLVGQRLELLRWLFAAVAILLLISMANASGVWLSQWLRQQRHAQIKLALGASFQRVLAEQCLQAALLGLGAAVFGLTGAQLILALLRRGAELPRFELWRPATLNWKIIAALLVLALTTSLAAAVVPMLVKARRSGRTRLALAIMQLTLTGTLAYSGLLVWRNVQSLLNADRGFRTEQILISGVGIPEAVYDTNEKGIRFHQSAIEELKKIPGVTAAAGGSGLPVSQGRTNFQLDDDRSPRDQQPKARIGIASAGLLELLQIPVHKGRGLAATDSWNTPRVALVNEAFVRQFMPASKDPVGHRLRPSWYNGFDMKPYEEHTIVGVIGDTLNRDLALETEPQILISSDQVAMDGFTYFYRTSLPASSLQQAVAQAIWNVDPAIERMRVTPLAAHVERSLMSRRALSWLLTLFGTIALAVVGFGLASSLTATFLEMSRELGIRAALGATPLRLAYESTRWGSLAILSSWLLTLPLCVAVSSQVVFDKSAAGFDRTSWILAGAALGLIGLAAGLIPARRAARVDPAQTLRYN